MKKSVVIGCVLLGFFSSCKQEKTVEVEKEPLPNILWLVAEDQSPGFSPCTVIALFHCPI